MPAKKKLLPAAGRKPRSAATADSSLTFSALVASIRQGHEHCAAQANRAVNLSLMLRNWLIGGYVHHYELNGQDRAK